MRLVGSRIFVAPGLFVRVSAMVITVMFPYPVSDGPRSCDKEMTHDVLHAYSRLHIGGHSLSIRSRTHGPIVFIVTIVAPALNRPEGLENRSGPLPKEE